MPLLITSSDLSTGGVRVFKSRYLQELGEKYVRDRAVLLRDAVLASCAAPSFFDPIRVDECLLADGGLWATNYSMLALRTASCLLSYRPQQPLYRRGARGEKPSPHAWIERKMACLPRDSTMPGTAVFSLFPHILSEASHITVSASFTTSSYMRCPVGTACPVGLSPCLRSLTACFLWQPTMATNSLSRRLLSFFYASLYLLRIALSTSVRVTPLISPNNWLSPQSW